MFVPPGYLTKNVQGYEKYKQQTIRDNLLEMKEAGIENPSKFIFGSNQSGKANDIDKRKKKIGRGHGDEDYVPCNDEERMSDRDNDDSSTSQVNKAKRVDPGKKKEGSTSQLSRKSQRNEEKGSTPQDDPTEQADPRMIVNIAATPEIPAKVSQNNKRNNKRKRGPTKLKTIAADKDSQVQVKFNEYGRPIGEGSKKLSSFLGALVREIVPFTIPDWQKLPSRMAEVLWQSIQVKFNLHEEWHREMVFQQMDEVWRASKSRLVKKIREASNEEERLKLQPDNIKSVHDWKDFVKEKTSADFKIKSDLFKEMRQIQLPLQHTMSRKGYAQLTDEMKGESKNSSISRANVWERGHKKKNGQPSSTVVQQKIDAMEKVEQDTPNLSSTNLNEDVVSKVLGAEKRGHLRTFGKGVTKTKLAILSQMSGHFSQLHEENMQLKSQMAYMQNSIDELKKNQVHHPATTFQTTPVVSPSSINTHSNSNKCKLLDWMGTGEVVAEGHWSSSDPKAFVHHIPIGPNAMRVWVEVSKKPNVYLWRTTSDMEFIKDAVGTTDAWPADKVLMDFTQGSTNG